MPTSKVVEAYAVLGLAQGCSLDTVKSTYKQIALRTHPDKNPDNPDATAEFQRVSQAYNVLLKHLNPSARPSPGYFSAGSADDYSEDEDYDDEHEYYEAHMPFYLHLFERMMNGGSIFVVTRGAADSRFRQPPKKESREEYEERVRRSHEEQLAAQERRKRESIARKEHQAREREQERLEAETRRKQKAQKKKAQAEADRKASEERTRALMKKAQEIRSIVFDAARKGDRERVKKGIWEDGVDAAGGEIKPGCVDFVKNSPEDPMETLMHISATKGDVDLIKWLDSHSADPEERNEQGMTPFHLAMKLGHIPIIDYFFDAYPPRDCPAIYQCSGCDNLLSLALQSHRPELVWMVLDKKLATRKELTDAWMWASGKSGLLALRGNATPNDVENADEIMELLKKYGGFSLGKEPENEAADNRLRKVADVDPNRKPAGPEQPRSVQSTVSNTQKQDKVHVRGHGRGKRQNRGQSSRPNH